MKAIARYIAAFIFGCAISLEGIAQDIHFSQYDQSPFNLNPALTGDFEGRHRFIMNQRTQWRSVTVPYNTWALSWDCRTDPMWFVSKKNRANYPCPPKYGRLNVGASFFADKAGDSRLSTNIASLNVSYDGLIEPLGVSLTPGISFGLTSMSIDYSKLTYDQQWNGLVYDPSISGGEAYSRDSRAYVHLHAGLLGRFNVGDHGDVSFGASVFNLTSPMQSWFDNAFVRLDRRTNIHVTWNQDINERFMISPGMLWMAQGPYREFSAGGKVHYLLSNKSWMYRSIYLGAYRRAKDAGFISAGIVYDDWQVGLSYDINTSNLKPASNGKGGLEFSVIWVIQPDPIICRTKKVCPDYL